MERQDRYFDVLWINPATEQRELFFQLKNTGQRGVEVPYYEAGVRVARRQPADHISFHADGTVHVTCKRDRSGTERIPAGTLDGGPYGWRGAQVVPLVCLGLNTAPKSCVPSAVPPLPDDPSAFVIHVGSLERLTLCVFLTCMDEIQCKAESLCQRFGIIHGNTPFLVSLELGEPKVGSQCLFALPTTRAAREIVDSTAAKSIDPVANAEWLNTIAIMPPLSFLDAML